MCRLHTSIPHHPETCHSDPSENFEWGESGSVCFAAEHGHDGERIVCFAWIDGDVAAVDGASIFPTAFGVGAEGEKHGHEFVCGVLPFVFPVAVFGGSLGDDGDVVGCCGGHFGWDWV